MKTLKLFMLLIMASLVFASCTQEEPNADLETNSEKSVTAKKGKSSNKTDKPMLEIVYFNQMCNDANQTLIIDFEWTSSTFPEFTPFYVNVYESDGTTFVAGWHRYQGTLDSFSMYLNQSNSDAGNLGLNNSSDYIVKVTFYELDLSFTFQLDNTSCYDTADQGDPIKE